MAKKANPRQGRAGTGRGTRPIVVGHLEKKETRAIKLRR